MQCWMKCTAQQYRSDQGICVDCDSTCNGCSETATKCKACIEPRQLTAEKKCEIPCDPGYYRPASATTNDCQKCSVECET
jgi:hypothetical protein